ncbi:MULTISPECIES: glutamate--cysteine ligase [Methylobacterium]|jgi:glutamate--cysteine ligase|uniref:glutamate--cysteine ligase n=2 Tax=Methylobacteriaceae TaxID=119045 RepID=UPI0008F24CED|nr:MULTISPECIES: glutamate--cysteine ligase [Methylobacterium]MBK3398717.1 glutamate--cysteine ligase [Methylobacterium ajmalii]MBK3409447.1 glutamate--cysteine ligase [Methylobacterium ajmalii]MBZ6412782.1 glutamate--cysteine ligase [Methylobacterium sp.]SFE12467.1 glutamate--cysteine ligase [Methylobacterium sp. yr596]
MARDVSDATPLSARSELIEWFSAGEKPHDAFAIGTEHEKVPFYRADHAPVPYEGENGIEALLEGLRGLTGWETIEDAGRVIGLSAVEGGGAISLEPGGQFELSGAPLPDVHATAHELSQHLDAVGRTADPLGIGFLTLGMSPKWTREETPVMPKSRYRIMKGYMPKVGSLGLDMMLRTATVQVNLDFASEADMVTKMRVGLALQPVATALFANSPFTDGKPNGFLSRRSEIWRDTDRDRTGMLPFAFDDGFGYEAYADWLLDMPMYFVKRGETYHDVSGASFRDLMAGRLSALPGERATVSDWANHASTAFPEVRLKRFLEMRGADVGDAAMIAAQAAFWTGLYYDQGALDGAWQLVRELSAEERETMRAEAPRLGLDAPAGKRTLRELARDALALAEAGLKARARRDAQGRDETLHLAPLQAIAATRTRAEDLLALYHGPWNGSVDPVFGACAF